MSSHEMKLRVKGSTLEIPIVVNEDIQNLAARAVTEKLRRIGEFKGSDEELRSKLDTWEKEREITFLLKGEKYPFRGDVKQNFIKSIKDILIMKVNADKILSTLKMENQ